MHHPPSDRCRCHLLCLLGTSLERGWWNTWSQLIRVGKVWWWYIGPALWDGFGGYGISMKMSWDQHVDAPKIQFREPAPLDKQENIHLLNGIELYVRIAEYRPLTYQTKTFQLDSLATKSFLFNLRRHRRRRRRLRCEIHKRHSMYISTRPAPYNQAADTRNHHAKMNHNSVQNADWDSICKQLFVPLFMFVQ